MDIYLLGFIFISLVCAYFAAPFIIFAVTVVGYLYILGMAQSVLISVSVVLALLTFSITRRYIFALPIFSLMKALGFLPTISKTEKEAIEAGTTWVDADLFSGKPKFSHLLAQDYSELSEDEKAYLAGPVEQLCEQVNDWDVYQNRDFPEHVWDMLKKQRFFGLVIPKEYGGLGFSATGNSAVVSKVGSRSTPLGITVMVPNSLGPAELLTHYGTQSQKDYYLPRLAVGEEIPCFALTEPGAGSDAGAMTSSGEVFLGEDGKPWLRLNWNKRYITLASKATLLGLAFKCYDPENILSSVSDRGITCALISTKTKGVIVGDRHDPLGVPFYNCPTQGENVEVPMDAVIGGADYVGKGWSMLMECLSAGRGISIPANCAGGAKLVSRVVGSYSMIRKQFGLEIGKFEGIQEPIAEIVGISYMLEAARLYTCAGLDKGLKPAVISAIAKYHFTEQFRKSINHGMDVVGGAGISLGPRNVFGHPYMAAPIAVTVEGANILTRSLMIFGQGAIRCHPYALDEIKAIEENDLGRFDKAFWSHQGHIISNFVRWIFFELTRGYLIWPARLGKRGRYIQKLTWMSTKFAFFADVAMILLGGGLKLRERLTSRYSDILSWLYLATTVLKRYEADGSHKEDLIFVQWCLDYSLSNIQTAFIGLFKNMGLPFVLVRLITQINPVGFYPSDSLSSRIARAMQEPGEQRDRLTQGIYLSEDTTDPVGRLDHAFKKIHEAKPLYLKLRKAIKKKQLVKSDIKTMIQVAREAAILTDTEVQTLLDAEVLRDDAVAVDSFSQETYMQTAVKDMLDTLK
jgi:acyl-CoA dehydrogenase